MSTKPSIPQGTRDFNAVTLRKRNHILSTIKTVFELYGFQPLETPAMENLETLMGKYGEEGDKLIFRILDSGNPFDKSFYEEIFIGLQKYIKDQNDYLKETLGDNSVPIPTDFLKLNPPVLANVIEKLLTDDIFKNYYLPKLKNETSSKALKYDLTIPFARYVAMNHTKLTYPFRRYQVQPVWRADRPQKGRYREFTQCDADIVGNPSLLSDAEFALIYDEVFNRLGLTGYELRINSRKILSALATVCNAPDKLVAITTAIDKLDKIGIDKVKEELIEKGLSEPQIAIVEKYISIAGSNEEKIQQLVTITGGNEEGNRGIEEITNVLKHTTGKNIIVDFTLARGLNYYTGIIYEAKAPATVKMGSIGGGGRYDDLTGLFGVPGIPGVGISFGVDRIYDVLEELNLFPENLEESTKAIFFNMGVAESAVAFNMMQQLRKAGIACILFHEETKIAKQFSYAEKYKIPYAIIIGSKEIEQNYCQVKNLNTGEQHVVKFENLVIFFNSL
ncbi:histidine--tRNA ligase [Ferruginibacter sp.]